MKEDSSVQQFTFAEFDAVFVTRSTFCSRAVFKEGFVVLSWLIISVWMKQHGSCALIVLIEAGETCFHFSL